MSCALAISTKPNPRDRPVILSMITVAEVTAPTWLNRSSRSALVVENERLPTNNFVATKNLQTQKGPENHECGSRGQLSLEPNSEGQQNKPDLETIAGLGPNTSQESEHHREDGRHSRSERDFGLSPSPQDRGHDYQSTSAPTVLAE